MPDTFTLTIRLGNEAVQDAADVARALRGLTAARLADGAGRILDDNGNTVGRWQLDGGA